MKGKYNVSQAVMILVNKNSSRLSFVLGKLWTFCESIGVGDFDREPYSCHIRGPEASHVVANIGRSNVIL